MAESSYMIAPGESTDSLALRRKMLLALSQKNMQPKPIDHWAQGLAHLADSAYEGYELGKINREEKAESAKGNALLAALFQPSGSAPSTATPAVTPGAVSMAPTNGKVYENDEPSPLDPPSSGSRDMLARALLAEAGNQGPEGLKAVANVVRNRAVAGNFGGDTVEGVLQKPNQFEPFNTAGGRQKMAAIDPNSPAYRQAGAAIDSAYAGDDPTRGATHFYAPKTQAALGRPAPAWDSGTGVDIKDHRFFGGAGTPPVMAGASPTDVSAQAVRQPQMAQSPGVPNRETLIQMLGNRKTAPIAQQIISQQIQQQFKPAEYDIHHTPDGRIISTNKRDPSKVQVTPVPGAGQAAIEHAASKAAAEKRATRQATEGLPATSEEAASVRKEIQGLPSYKNITQAAPIYKTMFDSAGRNTKASDLNLVYGLGKIFDPGSVVREGEMVMVKNTAGIPDWLVGTINSLNGGAALTPETREAIMREAHSRITSYREIFDQDIGMYRGIAQRGRMNEADVIPQFGEFQPYQRPQVSPTATATTGAAAATGAAPDRAAIEAEMRRRKLLK